MLLSKFHRAASLKAKVFALLDPSVYNSGSISQDGLRITGSVNAYRHGITNLVLPPGKWYWEVVGGGTDIMVPGFTTEAGWVPNGYALGDSGYLSVGVRTAGGVSRISQNGIIGTLNNPIANGQVIGFAVDSTVGRVTVFRSGVGQVSNVLYTPSTNKGIRPAVSCYGASSYATFKFGASGFSYPVPSGYQPPAI